MDSGGCGVGEGLGVQGEDAMIRICCMRKVYFKLKRKEDVGEEYRSSNFESPLIAQGDECHGVSRWHLIGMPGYKQYAGFLVVLTYTQNYQRRRTVSLFQKC